jgi:hypothetical protein
VTVSEAFAVLCCNITLCVVPNSHFIIFSLHSNFYKDLIAHCTCLFVADLYVSYVNFFRQNTGTFGGLGGDDLFGLRSMTMTAGSYLYSTR